MSRPGRPMGELSRALLQAAQHGPATVVQLAERACVGYGAARYTASRLVSTGALARVGDERPARLVLAGEAQQQAQDGEPALDGFVMLSRIFWAS